MKKIVFAIALSCLTLPAYARDSGHSAAAVVQSADATANKADTAKNDCLSGRKAHSALCNNNSGGKSSGSHLGVDKKLKPITLHQKKQSLKPLF